MGRPDMVRIAMQELGDDARSDQVGEFIRHRFSLDVGSQFVPIYRATIRAEEQLRQAREMAAKMVADQAKRLAKGSRAGRE
jgi:hypothetical protein